MHLRRVFLWCGVLASLLYVAVDVAAAIHDPAYHSFSERALSELMASGAPTERLVDPPFLLYGALMLAFGVGVWMSSGGRTRVRVTAALLVAYAAIGLLGPTLFEMDVRDPTGTRGPTAADIRHIALTGVLVLFIVTSVAVGAAIRGRAFRLYSIATIAVMLVFGILTSVAMGAPGGPTSWMGLVERVNVGAFLLWVAVLAVALLRLPASGDARVRRPSRRALPPSPYPAG
jgi:hypothetical protein